MDAVRTVKLRRTYSPGRRRGETVALDGVELTVRVGEVHGLLGPNGAGKTTLCKILSTVLLPTSGRAEVLGLDIVREARAVRGVLGIVFGGERGLYPRLTARENLDYWAAMYGLGRRQARARVDELLARLGLAERARQRVELFSRGMKQRVHLARGLIGDPRVLVLDEPTTGMDPVAVREFRTLVDGLREEGRSCLITTHDMAEAEAVCDRVTFIDRGRILATESPRVLSTLISRHERVEVTGADPRVLNEVSRLPGVGGLTEPAPGVTWIQVESEGAAAAVVAHLGGAGISSIKVAPPDLKEVYLHLIGDRGMEV